MEKRKEDPLVEALCIGICDGYGGRCQRYPSLSRTCEDFLPMEKAYKAGIRKVVESTVLLHGMGGETTIKSLFELHPEGYAQLQEWGIQNVKIGE